MPSHGWWACPIVHEMFWCMSGTTIGNGETNAAATEQNSRIQRIAIHQQTTATDFSLKLHVLESDPCHARASLTVAVDKDASQNYDEVRLKKVQSRAKSNPKACVPLLPQVHHIVLLGCDIHGKPTSQLWRSRF